MTTDEVVGLLNYYADGLDRASATGTRDDLQRRMGDIATAIRITANALNKRGVA